LALEGYHVPYRTLTKAPRRVLVLGAGTGNDVAVALDEGAEQIDAVEIDPVILQLGRKFHPDHPYDSSKVRIFNTDARSYLNHTTES
jgi:spermidine synthase